MATTGHESEVVDVQGLASSMVKAMNLGIPHKGTCATAADTAAKTVQTSDGFTLTADAMVLVTFQNAISAASATLNVNSTGAKPIYYRGAALAAGMVKAGDTLALRYDGTVWNITGTLDTDTDTVTDVSYDQTTGKLQKTVNDTTIDVVSIVNSGFRLTHNNTTGADEFEAIGSATLVHDDTTGADKFIF